MPANSVKLNFRVMFLHIVCWKYKAETTQEEKEKHLQMLRSLKEIIPNILSFHVGQDELHLERSFDTGLVATYPNREAFEFYDLLPGKPTLLRVG